jgi:hypothetical protein
VLTSCVDRRTARCQDAKGHLKQPRRSAIDCPARSPNRVNEVKINPYFHCCRWRNYDLVLTAMLLDTNGALMVIEGTKVECNNCNNIDEPCHGTNREILVPPCGVPRESSPCSTYLYLVKLEIKVLGINGFPTLNLTWAFPCYTFQAPSSLVAV